MSVNIVIIVILSLIISVTSELIKIREELSNGTEIQPLTRYLKLLATNQPVNQSFRLINDNDLSRSILVASNTGIVTVKGRIDRESLCQPDVIKCTIQLKFLMIPLYQSVSTEVEIVDINDNTPTWSKSTLSRDIVEFDGKKFEDRFIYVDKAYDPDANENGRLSYLLKESDGVTENGDFNIKSDSPNSNRLTLYPIKVIDKERVPFYQLVLLAHDNGSPKLTGTLLIKINVLDKNDNSPIFEKPQYRNDALSEISEVGTRVLTVLATDKDADDNGNVRYMIDDQVASKYFSIDKNGHIVVKSKLDYDKGIKSFRFIVLASDGAPEAYRKTGECEVFINLKDENDEKPDILINVTTKDPVTDEPTIVENDMTPNLVLAHVQVKDIDFEGTDRVTCLLNENTKMRLEMASSSSTEYQIIAMASFDREERSKETVIITCQDQALNKADSSITFKITDENDNTPTFTRVFQISIKENLTNPHAVVGDVRAVDRDAGKNAEISYEIVGEENRYFSIDASGRIFTRHSLDREETDRFNLTLLAKDGGKPSRTGTTTVVINVLDINDWPPEFNSTSYEFSINENSPIGSLVGFVMATDRDLRSNTFIKYKIMALTPTSYNYKLPFKMISGNAGEIVTKFNLDREEQNLYILTVIAEDNGLPVSFTSTTTVRITITDLNDNRPIFGTNNYTKFSVEITDSVGHEIGFIRATDADYGDNSLIDYRIISGNSNKHFALNPATGKLNLAYQIARPGDVKLVIEACDKGVPKLCSRPLSVIIKITKVTASENSEGPYPETHADSKTYIFIICVLVIFLFIVLILVMCAFIFKNRNCLSVARPNQCSSGDLRSNDPSNVKMTTESRYQSNGNNESLLVPNYPNTAPPGSVTMQNQNFDSTLPHRERQMSSEYQSIGGNSPPYNHATSFNWDITSVHHPANEMMEPLYVGHQSVKDYYYPSPTSQLNGPYCSYNPRRFRSPSNGIRMNIIPKELDIAEELPPRNSSDKRYNSLLNFYTTNSNQDNYHYKSLRKPNPKASYV